MLGISGIVQLVLQERVQLSIRNFVIRLANGLKREIRHGAVVFSTNHRVVGVLLVGAAAEEDVLHLVFRVLDFALGHCLPGVC